MSESSGKSSGKSSDRQAADSGRGLHYVIAFTSFALVVLVLASGKVRERLREEQQEFHGIQQMQGAGGQVGVDASEDAVESVAPSVTLRPLVWLLIAVLIAAWLLLLWRRFHTFRNRRDSP